MKYDHFHCVFEKDGVEEEIEGGFSRFPNEYDNFTKEQVRKYLHNLATSWGMPEDATIKHFWLAG